ncbi:hypothetical protein HII28_10160 [Planctomonas sp. JC2975]|uniref:hypothetical protein n=1 Tax=Planctomonas sp. JC2975 TaxID=2729626 RepID=UPI001475C93F|nr:hypothetical protein [Planctomonas sp. JC2975]NNC12239.1 hypothetical protein [Planctomonas sp. JC2975]
MSEATQDAAAGASEEKLRESGDRLRERIYVTFTAIAVLMAMSGHGVAVDPAGALLTLVVTVVGVLLAGFTSDVVSYMLVHHALPGRRDFTRMLAVSLRALLAILVPAILFVLAIAHVITAGAALRASIIVLLITLGVIVWRAVGSAHLAWWKSLLVLGVVVGLGILVVLLELFAHLA